MFYTRKRDQREGEIMKGRGRERESQTRGVNVCYSLIVYCLNESTILINKG